MLNLSTSLRDVCRLRSDVDLVDEELDATAMPEQPARGLTTHVASTMILLMGCSSFGFAGPAPEAIPQVVVQSLKWLGLDPPRLSAAGLAGESAVAFMSSSLTPAPLDAALRAEASLAQAAASASLAEHAIAASGTTPARADAFASTRSLLAATSVERDTRLIAAREQVSVSLTGSVDANAGVIARQAMAKLGRDLPAEWCALAVSPDDLATLERAARKARLGRELTEAEATAVAAAESAPIVTIARQRIDANAAAIREVLVHAQSLPSAP